MRYEAGICTIVISMNGAFIWCPFCCRLNFDPKSWKNHGVHAFDGVQFLTKVWPTVKSTFRTSFESSFDADHNGIIPSFISHSITKIQCVIPWTMVGYTEARYLGLRMRYMYCMKLGNYTIAISMNRAFKWRPFAVGWILTQNHENHGL